MWIFEIFWSFWRFFLSFRRFRTVLEAFQWFWRTKRAVRPFLSSPGFLIATDGYRQWKAGFSIIGVCWAQRNRSVKSISEIDIDQRNRSVEGDDDNDDDDDAPSKLGQPVGFRLSWLSSAKSISEIEIDQRNRSATTTTTTTEHWLRIFFGCD